MKYVFCLLLCVSAVHAESVPNPPQAPPVRRKAIVTETMMPRGDYRLVRGADGGWKTIACPCTGASDCGCSFGADCSCAGAKVKKLPANLAKSNDSTNPWRWTDEEGGYWWRWEEVKPAFRPIPQPVYAPVYAPVQAPVQFGTPFYGNSFGGFSAPNCVNGNCSGGR